MLDLIFRYSLLTHLAPNGLVQHNEQYEPSEHAHWNEYTILLYLIDQWNQSWQRIQLSMKKMSFKILTQMELSSLPDC